VLRRARRRRKRARSEGKRPPEVGDLSVVLDGHDHPVCIIETTEVKIVIGRAPTQNAPLVCERFKVVYKARLEPASPLRGL
jgi:uncharacterized protein YhfF